jgi:hypothetical protein
VTLAGHDTEVVDVARLMSNVDEPDDPVWLESPAYVYEAVEVPALTLETYEGVGVRLNPPAPVTATVHTVCAEPVNTTLGVHVSAVELAALSMVKVVESAEPKWFASPT